MSQIDLVQGSRRSSGEESDEEDDGSLCYSDADADDGASCYSHFYSTAGGSYDEHSFSRVLNPEISGGSGSGRAASASDCSVEMETLEVKVHSTKVEKDCRICHLGLESSSHEGGVAIQLGCSCKDDLGAAHKNCAETWFKIKGNKICEICNSIAKNVLGVNEVELITEQPNEAENAAAVSAAVSALTTQPEPRNFWQGHRFLNFLLACMVFAFVISWLFHFNVPSS